MEIKEKLYPTLPNRRENPTAPDVEMEHLSDGGHSYRLKVISDVQKFLEEEIAKRDAFSKKYFRITKFTNTADSILITITFGAGVTGAALLATVVVLCLEIGAAATGLISLLGNVVVRKTTKPKNT